MRERDAHVNTFLYANNVKRETHNVRLVCAVNSQAAALSQNSHRFINLYRKYLVYVCDGVS